MNKPLPTEIITYHGWGMDGSFWREWEALLPDHVSFKCCDRGYFGSPKNHLFDNEHSVKILFVQGFGLHWVHPKNWNEANLIVLFSTFNQIRKLITKGQQLEQVIHNLEYHLEHKFYATLESYWDFILRDDGAFMNSDHIKHRNLELLEKDLESLQHALVRHVPTKEKTKVVLYETLFDELVTVSQKSDMYRIFGKLNAYHQFNIVGHGFPYTHAKECFDHLKEHTKANLF